MPPPRVERFRASIAAADLGPFSSRGLAKIRRDIRLAEQIILRDHKHLIKEIDSDNSWKAKFGWSRATVLRVIPFSTKHDLP
jgi:hypothetical protein